MHTLKNPFHMRNNIYKKANQFLKILPKYRYRDNIILYHLHSACRTHMKQEIHCSILLFKCTIKKKNFIRSIFSYIFTLCSLHTSTFARKYIYSKLVPVYLQLIALPGLFIHTVFTI